MNIEQEKIEKLIGLDEKYRASSRKMEEQLKAIGKSQIDLVIPDLQNSDRNNVFDYINNLSKIEQDAVKALMRFGEDLDVPSKENFKYYVKNTRFAGEHDIDYMIAKPLSKYLKKGLMKLDLVKRNN